MSAEAERKLIRDGLVKISDQVSELLADKFVNGEDATVLSALHTQVWELRQSLGLFGGDVLASEATEAAE